MTAAAGQPATPRVYRLAPLDRTGVLLGLNATQCFLLAVGVFAAGAALQARLPAPVVGGPILGALVLGFATWDGAPLHQLLPSRARYLLVRGTWRAHLPTVSSTATVEAEWPQFLAGVELVDHDGLGVVADRGGRLLTASVPVMGREFSLAERAEQDRILHGWGEVLNGFCRERSAVCRVRVTEWAGPEGIGDLDGYLAGDTASLRPELLAAYRDLIADAAAGAVGHEVLISVTVDARRIRRARGPRTHGDDHAAEVLHDEIAALAGRLGAAGFPCGPALDVRALAKAIRTRLDPTVLQHTSRPGTLAEAAGIAPWNAAPLSCDTDLRHLRADRSMHRAYWIADWPRLDQGPNWLEPLLLHAGGTRTFALHYEPVARSRSQRRVDRDSTRLAADEEHRTRAGFRIGANHRRAQTAVAEREAELVAGYCELEYAGFVVVTAPDLDTLEHFCAEYEQAAAQIGLQLRPLDGSHDLGVACTLPMARGVALRWTTP